MLSKRLSAGLEGKVTEQLAQQLEAAMLKEGKENVEALIEEQRTTNENKRQELEAQLEEAQKELEHQREELSTRTAEGIANLECEDKEEVKQVHAEFERMLQDYHRIQNENYQEELKAINDQSLQQNEHIIRCVDLLMDIKSNESQSQFITNSFAIGEPEDAY